MLRTQIEPIMSLRDEMMPLLLQHHGKLGLFKNIMPLEPFWAVYAEAEAKGQFFNMTVRDANRLVAYWWSFVNPAMHYASTIVSHMDIWNVIPEYDGTVVPLVLMRAVERELATRNVAVAYAGSKIHRPCERLYESFGYSPIETTWAKPLKGTAS